MVASYNDAETWAPIISDPEIWKPFHLDGNYLVSDQGRIKNKHGRILKGYDNGLGYKKFEHGTKLGRKYMYKHRAVAFCFCENDDPTNRTQVDHLNRDRGDNKASNLEWVTPKENNRRMRQMIA